MMIVWPTHYACFECHKKIVSKVSFITILPNRFLKGNRIYQVRFRSLKNVQIINFNIECTQYKSSKSRQKNKSIVKKDFSFPQNKFGGKPSTGKKKHLSRQIYSEKMHAKDPYLTGKTYDPTYPGRHDVS